MNTQPSVDFGDIASSVQAYDSPVDGHKPLEVHSTETVPEAMTELIRGLRKRAVDSMKCTFWLHPNQEQELLEETKHIRGSPSFCGRTIRVEKTIPENFILFAAPDAIGLGGKVYNPLMVAYCELHDISPERQKTFQEKWKRFQENADDVSEWVPFDTKKIEVKKEIRRRWIDGEVTFTAGVPMFKEEVE